MASSPSPLSPSEIAERVRAQFGEDVLEAADAFGHAVLTVAPHRYQEVGRFLRNEPELDFDFFDCAGEATTGPRGAGSHLVPQLYPPRHNHHARLKVHCAAEDPRCPTISDVWPGANWAERETWELFGIVFDGHPHLVKLLLPEQFEGHPLRKDFMLMTREAKPWPGGEEGEE